MTREVVPVEHCPNCKQTAPCRVLHPPPYRHSGYECTACGEVRWGGISTPNGGRVIGYRYSVYGSICWRCARKFTPPGESYPRLTYLKGYMEPLYHLADKENTYRFDHHCDECGVRIDADC